MLVGFGGVGTRAAWGPPSSILPLLPTEGWDMNILAWHSKMVLYDKQRRYDEHDQEFIVLTTLLNDLIPGFQSKSVT